MEKETSFHRHFPEAVLQRSIKTDVSIAVNGATGMLRFYSALQNGFRKKTGLRLPLPYL
jgi:hypothetical protein